MGDALRSYVCSERHGALKGKTSGPASRVARKSDKDKESKTSTGSREKLEEDTSRAEDMKNTGHAESKIAIS